MPGGEAACRAHSIEHCTTGLSIGSFGPLATTQLINVLGNTGCSSGLSIVEGL